MAGLCRDCRYWELLEEELTDLVEFDQPYGTCLWRARSISTPVPT